MDRASNQLTTEVTRNFNELTSTSIIILSYCLTKMVLIHVPCQRSHQRRRNTAKIKDSRTHPKKHLLHHCKEEFLAGNIHATFQNNFTNNPQDCPIICSSSQSTERLTMSGKHTLNSCFFISWYRSWICYLLFWYKLFPLKFTYK